MNAPDFNFDNLPIQADSHSYMFAAMAEQKRVCGAIDMRQRELENKFIAMVDEMNALKRTLEKTTGFFARWGIRNKMQKLAGRISDNRDMRYELVCARIKRTYA